jgi:hypothetical protein
VVVSGATVDFSLLNNTAGASFVGGDSNCVTSGAGTCSIQINGTQAGSVEIQGTTTVTVLGESITRTTGTADNTAAGGSGNADKDYVNLRISLSPLLATNQVGEAHTITATVQQDTGSGFTAVSGATVTFSLSNNTAGATFVAGNTCVTAADGTCSIQITSSTAGNVDISGSTTVTVSGESITRTTGTQANTDAGGTGNANKKYVNLRISLTPLAATNPVGTNHTITALVEQHNGTAWSPLAGALVTFSEVSDTANTTFVGGVNTCTTAANGQCSIQITSPTAGTVVIQATTTATVSGETITRTTNTAENTAAGGSGNASKTWLAGGAVLLIIDEDSIDNGIHFNASGGLITPDGPDFFGNLDVNDDKPSHTQRDVLRYFAQNVGRTITVKTGQTGDEGWFAPNCIPAKWLSGSSNACLTDLAQREQGISNYFGTGAGVPSQSRLDKIPAVMPLRALGLNSLVGKDICAVVYDSDISINYDKSTFPFTSGNLQGETLGVVAFTVNQTTTLNGFSSSTLPQVTLTIRDSSTCGNFELFNAPVPRSSSVPNDRIAPGSPTGYRALVTQAGQPLFY